MDPGKVKTGSEFSKRLSSFRQSSPRHRASRARPLDREAKDWAATHCPALHWPKAAEKECGRILRERKMRPRFVEASGAGVVIAALGIVDIGNARIGMRRP